MYKQASISMLTIRESNNHPIKTPADVYDIVQDISDLSQETMQVITVNTGNRMIDRHLVSLGIADAALCHRREVFRPAIQNA